MDKILIVEDENITRLFLRRILEAQGFEVIEETEGRGAVKIFRKEPLSAVLLDLNMPGMGGLETLTEMKKIAASIPVIIATSNRDLSTAVEAMKLGAYDFLLKPIEPNKLVVTVKRAVEKLGLEREVKRLNTGVNTSLEARLGKSPAIKKVIEQVSQVALSGFSIIIQGETGTGKTHIANMIHNLSRRAKGPFVKVDVGVIPEGLAESELFGYEKGAFTGAATSKKGFFTRANGGTILIDELENLSPFLQSKLLSVVEDRIIYPLGSERPVNIDVRVIAATNRDIKNSVAEHKFRDDLFFRIGEFIITIPPLRDRVEDIPFFARKFLVETCLELNIETKELTPGAMDYLMRLQWPGNIRELKNVMKKAALYSPGGAIRPEDLEALREDGSCGGGAMASPEACGLSLEAAVSVAEKKAIAKSLELSKCNKTKAAELLRIDLKTLRTKMRKYKLEGDGKNSL